MYLNAVRSPKSMWSMQAEHGHTAHLWVCILLRTAPSHSPSPPHLFHFWVVVPSLVWAVTAGLAASIGSGNTCHFTSLESPCTARWDSLRPPSSCWHPLALFFFHLPLSFCCSPPARGNYYDNSMNCPLNSALIIKHTLLPAWSALHLQASFSYSPCSPTFIMSLGSSVLQHYCTEASLLIQCKPKTEPN